VRATQSDVDACMLLGGSKAVSKCSHHPWLLSLCLPSKQASRFLREKSWLVLLCAAAAVTTGLAQEFQVRLCDFPAQIHFIRISQWSVLVLRYDCLTSLLTTVWGWLIGGRLNASGGSHGSHGSPARVSLAGWCAATTQEK
jgi:hypothetical protein